MKEFDVIAKTGMADGKWQMADVCNPRSAICHPLAFVPVDRVESRYGR